MAKIRKQVYIEAAQEARLKRLAKELGVSEAELIRRSIDAGLPPRMVSQGGDRDAWEEAKRFIRERMEIGFKALDIPRGWTRDELYDRGPR